MVTVNNLADPPGIGPEVVGITPELMDVTESPLPVTINGSGFGTDPNDVTITFQNGSGPAPVATVDSAIDSAITATVTVKVNGKKGSIAWDVVVTTSNGSDVLAGGFTVNR